MTSAVGTHPVRCPEVIRVVRRAVPVAWLAVLGALAAGCGSSPRPAATSPSHPSRTASASPAAPIRLGGWGKAVPVGGAAAHATPLAGDRDSLFVAAGPAILRLDPSTGAVLARRRLGNRGAPGPGPAVISAGALWRPHLTATGRVVVRALSLRTLRPQAAVRLSLSAGAGDEVHLTASRNDRLYVGGRHAVAVIDTRTARLLRRFRVTAGSVSDIAVNPAGTRLYVTLNPGSLTNARLEILDPKTGDARRPSIRLTSGGGYRGLAASDGGVWIETGAGGTGDALDFRPAGDLSRPLGPLTTAGGGWSTSVAVYRDVVWVSGITRVACADPRTGAVRASVRVPAPHGDAANLSGITRAGGRVFAHFDTDAGPGNVLLRLPSPRRCSATQ